VGKLLQQAGVTVVHEPLNEQFGMKNIPIAYPFVQSREDIYAPLLNDAVTFSQPWNKDVTHLQSHGLRKQLYKLLGGRSGVRWDILRLRRLLGALPGQVCLKDPFMSLATPYLVHHHRLKVLCMIRHPAAIHYGTEKQQWRFDINNLRKQIDLVDDFAEDIPVHHWDMADKHAAASIALLWKLMLRINQKVEKESPLIKLMTHEHLCVHPVDAAQDICQHFKITFTHKLEKFVMDHSQGTRVEARQGQTHDFKRDSKAIPNAWVGNLAKEDEQMIWDIAGAEIEQVYAQR